MVASVSRGDQPGAKPRRRRPMAARGVPEQTYISSSKSPTAKLDRLRDIATRQDDDSRVRVAAAYAVSRCLVLRHLKHRARQDTVGESELIQDRVVIGVGDRNQIAGLMSLRTVGMVI